MPIDGVTVDISGARLKTGADGTAKFNLRAGTYEVKVSKRGYKTVIETITVAESALSQNVTLIANT